MGIADFAQLGHLGQGCGGDDRPDPLDLFEAIAGGLQGGMAGKELDDELFSSPDLFHQEGQGWSQQLRLARGSVLEAIFCPEPLFDQLGAVLVQLAELLQDRILGRIQRQIVRAAIVGEHLGVDRITLGLQSLGLGVVPHPIRRPHAPGDRRAGEVIGPRLQRYPPLCSQITRTGPSCAWMSRASWRQPAGSFGTLPALICGAP